MAEWVVVQQWAGVQWAAPSGKQLFQAGGRAQSDNRAAHRYSLLGAPRKLFGLQFKLTAARSYWSDGWQRAGRRRASQLAVAFFSHSLTHSIGCNLVILPEFLGLAEWHVKCVWGEFSRKFGR